MDHFDPTERLVNLRVTHKRATVPVLESVTFKDPASAMKKMRRLSTISECAVIQTCNRVEIFALASDSASEAKADLERFWFSPGGKTKEAQSVLETSTGSEAVGHALRIAAGLESMVVGEDEILGQVRKDYDRAKEAGTLGPVLERVFQSALRVGKSVRTSTGINRGAVSVGSAGVELLRQSLGDLGRKKVLVIGAGEAGETVAKALAARKSGVIFVANRTHQRAVELAAELGGLVLPFDALEGGLATVGAAVVATSAPHYILSYPTMARVMAARRRKPLVVVDLAEPRNVDLTVARIRGLTLCNLDDLRGVMKSGIEKRSREVRRAEKLVEQGLGQVLVALKQDRVEPLITSIFRDAEIIRRKETDKAKVRMNGRASDGSDHQAAVVEDLSKVLVKRLLSGPVEFMRQSAAGGDLESLDVAERLFSVRSDEPDRKQKRRKPAAAQ